MSKVVDLLRKGDRLTLLIKFGSTPEQAMADVFEDYLSLLEECDFLRGEADRLRYEVDDIRNTNSRLEREAEEAHSDRERRLGDLEGQVYRLERENRTHKYRGV